MNRIEEAASELKEAARYVRTGPNHAKQLITNAVFCILRTSYVFSRQWELLHNLEFATDFMLVEPDVAKGYILGAAFELESETSPWASL